MRVIPGVVARARRGFTLIELLVVISLMLVLVAIAAMFVGAQEQDNAGAGARQLFSWLQMAKTQAMRDQSPRGIRLLPGTAPAPATQVQKLQFIQLPPDFSVQPGVAHVPSAAKPTAASARLPFRRIYSPSATLIVLEPPEVISPATTALFPPPYADFSGGFGLTSYGDWPVQAGDLLEVHGGGLVHAIGSTTPVAPYAAGTVLTLMTPLVQPIAGPPGTLDYRIIRAPRPSGDDVLELPLNVAIDLAADPNKVDATYTLPSVPFDILFAPSGAVVGAGAAYDKIILWVRDVTPEVPALNPWQNQPVLVCIYTRSGTIAAHPVDITGQNGISSYYTFTTDGRTSGQ